MSIPAQVREVQDFARRDGYHIEDIFTEQKTAKVPGRPIFADLLSRIEQGQAEGIVAWHPDRLSRNSVDAGKLIHLLDKNILKDLKFANHWFENTPQGIFILSIAFGQSKYFSGNLSENIRRGQRQKLLRGEYPSRAPFGYFNDKNIHKIIPDPNIAPHIKKIYEMFASGRYSYVAMAQYLRTKGVLTGWKKPMNQFYTKRILTSPFYIGLFQWKGEIHEGTHEPLISKDLFDRVQRVVKRHGSVK